MPQFIRDVTLYLVYLIFVTTLGPLQFGFHLVRAKKQLHEFEAEGAC